MWAGSQASGRAIQWGRAGGRRETLIRHNVCSWQVDTIPPEDLKGRLGPQGPRPLELGFTKCARASALCRALCRGQWTLAAAKCAPSPAAAGTQTEIRAWAKAAQLQR